MTAADSADKLALLPAPGGLPPEPEIGLIGRAAELQALEAALGNPDRRGAVLVYGYEGVGKTTLVAHAARELVQTGRFRNAVYTSLIGGGLAELAQYDLGQRLLGKEPPSPDKTLEEQLTLALRETPTLVIWDHVEALLPNSPDLPAGALGELLSLGARLTATGESRLCLLVDGPDVPDALRGRAELASSVAVAGLPDADGQSLLLAALAAIGRPGLDENEGSALVHALGGHPLALSLMAAVAAGRPAQPLSALWHDLESILPGLSTGEALLRNQGLEAAVEAWLRSFDETTRLQVLSLAPFVGGLMAPLAGTIALEEHANWKALVPRLVAARALRLAEIPGLSAQYAYLAPGLARRLDQRLTEPQRARLLPRYNGAYVGLLSWMAEHGAQAPQSMPILFRSELPNFRHALRLLLTGEQLSTGLQFTRQLQTWMVRLGLQTEAEHLAGQAKTAVGLAVPKEGPLPRTGMQLLLAQAEQHYASGQIPQALSLLAGLEKRAMAEKGLAYTGEEALLDRGLMLHTLGRYLAAMHQHKDAIQHYTHAAEQLAQATQTERVRLEMANVCGHLGDSCLASQQIEPAANAFQRGLTLAEGLKDQHLIGLMQVGLASVGAGRGDEGGAKELLHSALDHLQAAGDIETMVNVWEQLAVLALHKNDLAEAQTAFEAALACAQQTNKPALQAQVVMQLGRVAESAGHTADARARFEQVIQLSRDHKRTLAYLAAELSLASLLLRQGDVLAAKEHAMEARAVADQMGPQGKPWQAYDLLGSIAHAEGNAERVAHWRLAAIESYAASPEAATAVARWNKLTTAVLQACRGTSLRAEAVEALDKLEADSGWQAFVGAIWRILSGERGAELYTELDYMQGTVVRYILTELQKAS